MWRINKLIDGRMIDRLNANNRQIKMDRLIIVCVIEQSGRDEK